MTRALITGVTGQDGSYLAEYLLAKGYEVHGLKRRSSSLNTDRVDHIYEGSHVAGARFYIHNADLTDCCSLARLLHQLQPDEIYNLGAQSHVKVSFEMPEYTLDTIAGGALRLLEMIRQVGLRTRFFQASSAEIFGNSPPPQSENSSRHPCSPYACASLCAHSLVVNYRESYGFHASCGILFNHESPRRGETFVTRKISRSVAQIKLGLQHKLHLGNLDARRDWGYAPDYVRAMWLMLQQDRPDDYVIGTGESHSVREFVETAFAEVGLDWHDYVEIDPHEFRPTETDHRRADASKARLRLGWEPRITFREVVRLMVRSDLSRLRAAATGSKQNVHVSARQNVIA